MLSFGLYRIRSAAEALGIALEISFEYHFQVAGSGEVLGHTEGAVLFQFGVGTLLQNLRNEVGADIAVFNFPGDTRKAQSQADFAVMQRRC